MSNKLPVSIVICALNEEKRIKDAIKSAYDNNPNEVIVVEGGSTDKTLEIAKKYADKVYSVENYVLGYKRAYGAKVSTQKYILYLDADHILPKGSLETMINELDSRKLVGIQASLKSVKNETYWEEGMEFNVDITYDPTEFVPVIGMPCLYVLDILRHNNFDENIGAADDTDLCYRITKKGHKLGISSAICYQKHRSNFKSTMKKFLWYGEGDCEFGIKHKERLWSIYSHPIRNYIIKKSFLAIKKNKIKFVPFFVLTGLSRHIGFYKMLIKKFFGDGIDSRAVNRSDTEY
jgi:glycosyltransferase involved in cell wall biosynthesis